MLLFKYSKKRLKIVVCFCVLFIFDLLFTIQNIIYWYKLKKKVYLLFFV